MKIEQVACITFTIREFIKTPEDFRTSMKKLADIGYQAVQISGMAPDAMPEEEIAAVCAENGLTICATHEPSQTVLDEPEKVVERLKKLGTKYTAYPYPRDVDMRDPSAVKTLITKLDRAGNILRDAGQALTYHNHALEFVKQEGKPVLKHIYEGTDPANLQAEIDTYWVQLGGSNPVEWCESLPGRLPLLHLKDVGLGHDNKTTMVEIGNGNLDFKAIIAAAEASGCEWFIVEQDICPGDPFDSLKQSFDYIKANLVEA
jgi:sugar phosphate isomerase/epimerase